MLTIFSTSVMYKHVPSCFIGNNFFPGMITSGLYQMQWVWMPVNLTRSFYRAWEDWNYCDWIAQRGLSHWKNVLLITLIFLLLMSRVSPFKSFLVNSLHICSIRSSYNHSQDSWESCDNILSFPPFKLNWLRANVLACDFSVCFCVTVFIKKLFS